MFFYKHSVSADENLSDTSSIFPKAEAADPAFYNPLEIQDVAFARTGMPDGLWLFFRNFLLIMIILFAGYWVSGVMLRRKQR